MSPRKFVILREVVRRDAMDDEGEVPSHLELSVTASGNSGHD